MKRSGAWMMTVGACWLALLSTVFAASPIRVAVMDQQLVIEKSKAGKRALEELKAYSATRQKIISADDQELKELDQAIRDSKLSESARQEKQGQFQAKMEAYQRRLADFNREIRQKQMETVAEYSKKVHDAAEAVAQKEGYVAVIDKGNDAVIKIVIYHQPALDVTDKVVKEFDRQNK
ncbi:OmpH family outer membrane protein [Petrachloros mirabilis]|nr:OmpH family outer membrane protein [Nitrospira sp.]